MKRTRLLAMLLTLMIVFGSLLGTTALAATTTAAPAETTVVTEQAAEAEQDNADQSLGKQIKKILIFGAIVGVIAAGYGLTTMRYNQEKMDDMTAESRKIMERMRDDNE